MSLFGRRQRGLLSLIRYKRFVEKREEDRQEGRSFLRLEKEDRPYVENPNDQWEHIYQRNMVKLALMVLVYAFSEDDDQISRKEYALVKSFFKMNRKYLFKEDYDEIKNLFQTKLSKHEFLDYLEQKEYEASSLNDAIEKASSLLRSSGKYLLVVDELKQAFNEK
ncbi:hypothetical protein BK010_08915 [Tenericutes bacterium MO-XQ]|nr:hypothetical protein BK010_08405 [Tenericutes bacterium MO-XQ]AUD63703.1 hypothetical protein BK010_08915 [Tenericutes bacterium MO-XQ]